MLRRFGFVAIFCLVASGFQSVKGDFLGTIVGGHADIGVGFHDGALEPHIHIESQIQRYNAGPLGPGEYEPDQLWIGVTDASRRTRTAAFFPSTQFDFLGVGIGEDFWHLRASSFPGQPFIGFGAEDLDPADGWSNVTFKITGINTLVGSSEFSVWRFNPDNQLEWASTVAGNPTSFIIPAGAHDHWNMAFTGEGVFQVNFQFDASQNGNPFSATSAFTFAVGNSNFAAVPEPTSLALLACSGFALVGLRRFRRKSAGE
jgi:hypothetical protein